MSAVTEHLEQRGSAFELIPHRQAYTSTDEARALASTPAKCSRRSRSAPGPAMR